MKIPASRLAVLAGAVVALASPVLQATLDWGLSAKAFAAQGDGTLRAAPYAFAIWGPIYAGLLVYVVWQVLPRNLGSRPLREMAWPAAGALVGIGAWIWASAAGQQWLSVAVILASAGAAIAASFAACRGSGADRWLAAYPVAALGGWLTVASALNLVTAATAEGLIAPGQSTIAGLGAVVAVVGVALAVLRATNLAFYALPVAWGLAAVFVAEHGRHEVSAWGALAAAAIILLAAGASLRKANAGRR